jgi:membrane-bound lytic murein transglycosylase A
VLNAVAAGGALLLLLGTNGCKAPPRALPVEAPEPLVRISPSDCPAFADDLGYDGLMQAIDNSLIYLNKLPDEREFRLGREEYNALQMRQSLQQFQDFIRNRPPAASLVKFISDHYRVYQSVGRDGKGEVLYTGYYEPHLKGSLKATPQYRYPIYGRPDDLITADLGAFADKYKGEKIVARLEDHRLVPYHDRREIDAEGALYGKAPVLAWVSDPVDLFFLHIQGSGRITLEDGRSLNISYDTGNGHPFRSIGQLLIDEGRISREEMSMQAIRSYLNENPAEIPRILNHNPSYIFFRIVPDGPLGSLEVKLTPGRSLALDRALFPPAVLAFVETKKPLSDGFGKIQSWVDCNRFMLNQDTGGAIQGPGRADVFWGSGPYAETAAGHLKHPGRLFFLVLKPAAGSP